MSFTNNASKLTGKSITNSFNVVANNITVEQNELVKGNLTVLGNTNIGNVTLENGNVNNLTVNNLTVTTPIPYTSGGTGLSTIGSPNQVLTVNPTGTGLYYQGIALTNPSTITGTGFTGTPTFNFGIESSGGSDGRGFIRTSSAATSLLLESRAGTGGSITLGPVAALSPAVNIVTAGGIFNLATGAGQMNIGTAEGQVNILSTLGQVNISSNMVPAPAFPNAINISTTVGNIGISAGVGQIIMEVLTGGAITIGTTLGFVNIAGSVLTLTSGAVQGLSGIWNFTVGGFAMESLLAISLNAAGNISLNTAVGTIILNGTNTTMNGPTTMNGAYSGYTSPTLSVSTTTTTAGSIATFFAPSLAANTEMIVALGKSGSIGDCGTIGWNSGSASGRGSFELGLWGLGTPRIKLQYLAVLSPQITIEAGASFTVNAAQNCIFNGTSAVTTSGVLTVNNSSTGNANCASFFTPSLASGNYTTINLGRQDAAAQCAYLSFVYNTTATSISSQWGFSNASPSNNITLNGDGSNTITGSTTITASTGTPLTVSTSTDGASFKFFASGASANNTALLLGKANLSTQASFLSWEQNNQRLIMGVIGSPFNIELKSGSTLINNSLTINNGNVYVQQNINWGTLEVNSNTALAVNSPKTILVRGGSGVTITLPNATTLNVGWNYIINNNSNNTITISDFTSTVITTVLSGQLANVYLITNPNTAGTWDYHLAGSVNSVTATSPIIATGTVNPVISISPTAPISLGPVTITASTTPLTMNITGSAPSAALQIFKPAIGNSTLPITFGKSGATNLATVIRFSNSDTAPADNYLGLGFWNNDDLYKITVGGAHIWRNTTAETLVVTNTGRLISTGAHSGYLSPQIAVSTTTTTAGSIATFFAPSLAANTEMIVALGKSGSIGDSGTIGWNSGSASGRGSFELGLWGLGVPRIKLQYLAALSPQITIDSGGPCIINSNSVSPFTVNTTTDGGTFKFLASNAANGGSALIVGKADAGNQGSYLSWEQNNQRVLMGILGNSFNIELKSNSTTINNPSLSGQVPFRSTGTNFYGSPTQYCEIGCSNPATSGDESLDMAFMYLGRKFSEQSVRFSYKNNTVYRNWSFGMGITGNQDLFGIWSTAGGNQCCFGDLGQMPTVPNGIVNISKRSGNGQVMTFYNPTDAVGSIVVGQVTTYNTTSDYRLKENIVPMENTLQKVLLLKPVNYTWKKDSNILGYGFLAHELQEIFPTCVTGEKDAVKENGEPIHQQVDYGKLTPFLTAGLKDLYSLVQTLQDRITTLESQ